MKFRAIENPMEAAGDDPLPTAAAAETAPRREKNRKSGANCVTCMDTGEAT